MKFLDLVGEGYLLKGFSSSVANEYRNTSTEPNQFVVSRVNIKRMRGFEAPNKISESKSCSRVW